MDKDAQQIYLELAQRIPEIWNAPTKELEKKLTSICEGVETCRFFGTSLLNALDYADILTAVLQARYRRSRIRGAGGVATWPHQRN